MSISYHINLSLINLVIITKLYELDGNIVNTPEKSFSSVYNLRKHLFGHPSGIDKIPIKLTQFCYSVLQAKGFEELKMKKII